MKPTPLRDERVGEHEHAGELHLDSSEYRTTEDVRGIPTWGSPQVTWSFAETLVAGDTIRQREILTIQEVGGVPQWMREVVREAFEAWENVCGIDFVEVSDSHSSNIRIGSTTYLYAAQNPSVLGYWKSTNGTPEALTKGVIAIQPVKAITGSPEEFYDTVLHEVGHAVGLDHSDVANVVMSGGLGTEPTGLTPYWFPPGRDVLQPDDIAGAVALWGPPGRNGGSGNDTLVGGTGNDTINGGAGNDEIYGQGGDDVLLAGDGNDVIDGGEGNDRLWGQAGNDTLIGGNGDDLIFGQAGNDTIEGGAGGDVILSGEGEDAIAGGAGNDGIWAEGGNDGIDGGGGNDFLAGGTGNDTIFGDTGSDYLAGEAGDDQIFGQAEYDVFAGGPGDDLLFGGLEGDTFFGQEGADMFVITGGVNWIMDFDSSDRIAIRVGASLDNPEASKIPSSFT